MMGQTTERTKKEDPFWDLVATSRRLQRSGGCAWDRAQTVESLLPYLIEEVWELFETVRSQDGDSFREEAGDVLYTILFLILTAQREGRCQLKNVLRSTQRKMIRRHPHVFGSAKADSVNEAYQHWNATKKREQKRNKKEMKPTPRELRKLFVQTWDWILTNPQAQNKLERFLEKENQTSDT